MRHTQTSASARESPYAGRTGGTNDTGRLAAFGRTARVLEMSTRRTPAQQRPDAVKPQLLEILVKEKRQFCFISLSTATQNRNQCPNQQLRLRALGQNFLS